MSALYTIGYAKTTAGEFFAKLREAGVRRVIDTRLKADGQLSGFAKADDLRFFLATIDGIDYERSHALAPSAEMLALYRSGRLSWDDYATQYAELLRSREVVREFPLDRLLRGCLLCSEHTAVHCHRRIAAEFLQAGHANAFDVVHL